MTVTPLNRSAEPPAFDDFYRHYFVRVLVLVRRHFPRCDAEEIAQETMARCYTNYATLDHGRDPWPWVNSVARNAAIDSMRRNRRNVPSDEVPEVAASGEDATYDAVLVMERRRSVRLALKRLHPSDRQLVEDHDLEGMAYTEMAALRDMTPNALRQRLFRARHRLAGELRRVGATLGVVPVAMHARVDRAFRRVGDYAHAIGPVGASALSVAAVTGVATVATALGGTTPVTQAAARSGTAAIAPVDRADLALKMDRSRTTTSTPPRQPNVVRPFVTPPAPPPPVVIPVTYEHDIDPTKPGQPYSDRETIKTPLGELESEGRDGWVPGYGVLCWAGVAECPPPEDPPAKP